MVTRAATSFCRICIGHCGLLITVDDKEKIVDVRGDKNHPMTHGYACFMGLQAEASHRTPQRILSPLKRDSNGTFEKIPAERAFDEIAEKMRRIIDRDGPNAIGMFLGAGGNFNSATYSMARSFMSSLGSKQYFSTETIDQSAKFVAFERLGGWAAGTQSFEQSDVVLLFAVNPLVSRGALGNLIADPTRRLKKEKERGLKLIVVDPRRTETARHADLFVQPLPGQDAAIAAGLLRIILQEGWHDSEFCDRYVRPGGLAALKAAVEPFNPKMVAARAGIEESELFAIAEMFARDNKRGNAAAGTGTNMSPFGNVAQHLMDTLNVVCGRMRRPGDKALVDLMGPDEPVLAEVIPPARSWEAVPRSRIRGVGQVFSEKLSGTLADEILTPGEGQIRGLIVEGGNIANSMPDQANMVRALQSLELSVAVEPYMTATARLSQYVLPPKLALERPDLTINIPGFALLPDNFLQYTPAIVRPPPEVIDDWYFYWSIARRLGVAINYQNKAVLDMHEPPSTEDLLALRLKGGRITLEELKRYPHGKMFDVAPVAAPETDNGARFDLMPADVAEELRQFREFTGARTESSGGRGYTARRFLLSSRRMPNVNCSVGTHIDSFLARTPTNPLYMHPLDLGDLDLQSGDKVEVRSDSGTVFAVVEADDSMRRGVVSLPHGWGGLPGDENETGTCVNRLLDCRNAESVNAMPWMSAIPVDVIGVANQASNDFAKVAIYEVTRR